MLKRKTINVLMSIYSIQCISYCPVLLCKMLLTLRKYHFSVLCSNFIRIDDEFLTVSKLVLKSLLFLGVFNT